MHPLLLSWLEVRRRGTVCGAARGRTVVGRQSTRSELSSPRIYWADLRLSGGRRAPTVATVPAAAWEMIREWEESDYARLKPASETVNHELLARLTAALSQQRPQADASTSDAVPVTVI